MLLGFIEFILALTIDYFLNGYSFLELANYFYSVLCLIILWDFILNRFFEGDKVWVSSFIQENYIYLILANQTINLLKNNNFI